MQMRRWGVPQLLSMPPNRLAGLAASSSAPFDIVVADAEVQSLQVLSAVPNAFTVAAPDQTKRRGLD